MSLSPTIVIADADEEVRLAVCEAVALAEPQAEVIEVADGRALKRLLADRRIDLLFIDSILPHTDGLDLLAWHREKGDGCLIVIVTDLLAPHWPAMAKRVSAYDVLLKPLSDLQVERIVEASRTIRRRLNVLVAEPRVETQGLIGRLLGESRFRLDMVTAQGGREAVRIAETAAVDLALIDSELPDFPALEVACRINGAHPQAKIVLTGRSVDRGVVRQFPTFGISSFLAKPFGFAEIDRMLHETFGLWRPYLLAVLHAEERRQLEGLNTSALDGVASAAR